MIVKFTRPDSETLYVKIDDISCWSKSVGGKGNSTIWIGGTPHDVQEPPSYIYNTFFKAKIE